ncbi:glycosyltransferase [Azoarcus sp. CIB]|uniref:glycosyltransferase n=1 Tax=Aromatoleum sp. (strain CIB) TaxID=198107 RepID=UPI001E5FD9DA|nr:glycosyltransferase [Azoarcus sp. CIB]
MTVGSQMPFDRLVGAMDEWAETRAVSVEIVAQVGITSLKPRFMKYEAAVAPARFSELVEASNLIVAHAGMGSVLTALQAAKPIVLMPRLGSLQETRNDHQVATAKWLKNRPGVFVAMDARELPGAIERALGVRDSGVPISDIASAKLLTALRGFIHER